MNNRVFHRYKLPAIVIGLTAVLSWCVTSSDGAEAHDAASTRGSSSPSMSAQINEVLGLHGHEIWLPDFADALAGWTQEDKRDAAINRMVSKLVAGAEPSQLCRAIMDASHIKEGEFLSSKTPGWKYGAVGDRLDFAHFLWAAAQAKKDPLEASRFAKAAILFAGELEFEFDTTPLNVLFGRDPKKFADVAGIPPEQMRALSSLLGRLQQDSKAYREDDLTFAKTETELLASKGALDTAKVDLILKIMTRQRPRLANRPFRQWNIVMCLWDIKNLAHSRKDARAGSAIETFLRDWQSGATEEQLKRWIEEGLKNDGPEPPKLYYNALLSG